MYQLEPFKSMPVFRSKNIDGVIWPNLTLPTQNCSRPPCRIHCCQTERLLSHQAATSDDLEKAAAMCSGCKRSLMTKPLMLPRYALANDLWMGSCPKALLNLREGTQKLPPMVRACVAGDNVTAQPRRMWWKHRKV